jgi:hypothetical protein
MASTTPLIESVPCWASFGHGYFSLFGALLSELFPTGVRATAQGLTYNVGRGLGAPGSVHDRSHTQGIGSALMLTSAFFHAAVPETRGKPLAD